MEGPWRAVWVIWLVLSAVLLQMSYSLPESKAPSEEEEEETHADVTAGNDKPKLLYILLDGFRWDYVNRQKPQVLPGFNRFLKEGVKARWTTPIFPSVSYPSWTTLVTGLYAETHGIVGNYFYDPETKDVFSMDDETTTGKPKWWTSEPIWTTAEKAGMMTAQYIWSRCDVPIDDVVTDKCEPFVEDPKRDNFLRNIMKALENFDNGYDFVQVYGLHIDNVGHKYGPSSEELHQAVRDVDSTIDILLDELEERQLADKVNIVIVSDHGMTDTSDAADIQRHEIDRYLDPRLVDNIADHGAFMNIKVPKENVQQVYEQLTPIPGAMVYKKEDIPENFHFKNGKYVHDILVVAHQGHSLMPSSSNKQLPKRTGTLDKGSHGYGTDVQSMRGIFFAKGPAFQKEVEINPIHLVDVYQVLTNVLELVARPHNGTWSRVERAFGSSHRNPKQPNGAPTPIASSVLSLLSLVFVRYI